MGLIRDFQSVVQVEDKTPFARWYTPGAAPLPSDEAAADMFRMASNVLRSAGYEHYEISSYARPGKRCPAPVVHWNMRPAYERDMLSVNWAACYWMQPVRAALD